MQARLNDIYNIVGIKNPSLLNQIKKTPAKIGNQIVKQINIILLKEINEYYK